MTTEQQAAAAMKRLIEWINRVEIACRNLAEATYKPQDELFAA